LLSQSAKPVLQLKPHVPVVQVAVALAGNAQLLEHVPQCCKEVRSASQPFAAWLSQSAKPALQLAVLQTPVSHVGVPFAVVQTVVQVPQ
jgi:hypothetical protein